MSKGTSTKRSFVTPTSLTGRRLTGAKGSVLNMFLPVRATSDQDRWNEQVEAKKRAKKGKK